MDKVADMLISSGYRRLDMPFEIAGINIDIAAAFVGIPPLSDIVLVVDTAVNADQRILRKVQGVARVLDVIKSRRPLTTVIIGPRPGTTVLQAMTRVCRVLTIDPNAVETGSLSVRHCLAVLLPLTLPNDGDGLADPFTEIRRVMPRKSEVLERLLDATSEGTDSVRTLLYNFIDEVVAAEGGEDHA